MWAITLEGLHIEPLADVDNNASLQDRTNPMVPNAVAQQHASLGFRLRSFFQDYLRHVAEEDLHALQSSRPLQATSFAPPWQHHEDADAATGRGELCTVGLATREHQIGLLAGVLDAVSGLRCHLVRASSSLTSTGVYTVLLVRLKGSSS